MLTNCLQRQRLVDYLLATPSYNFANKGGEQHEKPGLRDLLLDSGRTKDAQTLATRFDMSA